MEATEQRDTSRQSPSFNLSPRGTLEYKLRLMVVLPQDQKLGFHIPSQAVISYGPSRADVNSGTSWPLFFFFFFFKLINLFLAALVFFAARGLFSSCSEQGLLFISVRRLLIVVASFVAEHRL